MKTSQMKPGSILVACMVGLLLDTAGVQAANITWGAAQNIAADSDVSTTGVLVRAANLTPLSPATTTAASFTSALNTSETVNGVTFAVQTRPAPTGTTYTLANGDVFVASENTGAGPGTAASQFAGFGGPSSGGTPANSPFNTLVTVAYQRMLSTAWWNDGANESSLPTPSTPAASARYTITLNGLTSGRRYELQVWVNDSRLSNLGEANTNLFTTFSDGATSVDLQHNVNNFLGGIGQFAIGTFTADATSQSLTMTGGTIGPDVTGNNISSLLNAYQLRDVTDPCATTAPTGSTSQSFCSAASPTVTNLVATGTLIKWYSASSGGTALAGSTALVNGTTYYASQTSALGCESTSRLAVTVTLNPPSAGGTASGPGLTCTGTVPTITLAGQGPGSVLKWQYSSDNFASDVQDIANTTTTLNDAPAITATTYYRAVVSACGAASANSSVATVAVDPAQAGFSLWGNSANGAWETAGNWGCGSVPNAAGASANFSILDITADATVALASGKTVGALLFGDTDIGSAAGWTVTGSTLTLDNSGSAATITVNSLGTARSATISSLLAGGTAGSVILTKSGSGRLVVSSTSSTLSGDITVSSGTLSASGGVVPGNRPIGSPSALGLLDPARTITVNNTAVLSFTNSGNVFAQGTTTVETPAPRIVVNQGGTLVIGDTSTSETDNGYGNNFGKITLNGGSVSLLKGFNGIHGAAMLTDTITVGGSAASTISGNGMLNSVACLGYQGSTVGTTFDVADATGNANADLTVSAPLRDAPGYTSGTSLTKTGVGKMVLTATNTYSGDTIVDLGVLQIDVASLSDTAGVSIANGAMMNLNFAGGNTIGSLTLGGTSMGNGIFNATTHPAFFTGGGSLLVGIVAPDATALSYSVSDGQLVLDWPADQGWRLQGQTNNVGTGGITTNWFPVIGATPPYTNSMNPANRTVFYRLIFP